MFKRKSKSPLYQYIKTLLGYRAKNIEIYEQAFIHHSVVCSSKGNNNERLEYLGDAILGAIVADFLYRKYPHRTEGFLTEMRSKLVSRDHLNRLSRKIGLDQFLIVQKGFSSLPSSIYGNTFEAFIGAIFLDKGFEKTKQAVIQQIFEVYVNLENIEKEDNNFKGKILHYVQKHHLKVNYNVVKEINIPYQKKEYLVYLFIDDKFVAEGQDFSIKLAEQNAAMVACEKLHLN